MNSIIEGTLEGMRSANSPTAQERAPRELRSHGFGASTNESCSGEREPLLLTAATAGDLLTVSEGSVRRLTKEKFLHPVEILPGMWRYSYAEVVNFARTGLHGATDGVEKDARRDGSAEWLGDSDRPYTRALHVLSDALAFTDSVNDSRIKLSKSEAVALGATIRCAREKLGLSQGQFARKVGVSQQKVSEWERGFRLRQVVAAWRLAEVVSQIR